MNSKLTTLYKHYEEIMQELSTDVVAKDIDRYTKLMKEQNDLEPIIKAYKAYLAAEKMDLTSQSTRKKDTKVFIESKIDKENYEVFLSRLKTNKITLLRNIYLIIDKYEGDYSEVFKKHYFENKEVETMLNSFN